MTNKGALLLSREF